MIPDCHCEARPKQSLELSFRAERRIYEIATPFGLAMTSSDCYTHFGSLQRLQWIATDPLGARNDFNVTAFVEIFFLIRYLKGMNDFKQIKAILFDFDGTLAKLNINFLSIRDRIFDLIRQYGVDEGRIKEKYLLEIIDEVYKILLNENLSKAEAFYKKAHKILYDYEIEGAKTGMLFPKVEETLKELRNKGLKIGIVTRNCEDAVRMVFTRIDDYCDIFISRDSIKNVKPHPDHLTKVINTLGVKEKEAMMIGDHKIDIQAGQVLGIITVGVLTGRTKVEEFEEAGADYILNDVSEVINFFKN